MNMKKNLTTADLFAHEEDLRKEKNALRARHEKDLLKKQSQLQSDIASLKAQMHSLEEELSRGDDQKTQVATLEETPVRLDPQIERTITDSLVSTLGKSLA